MNSTSRRLDAFDQWCLRRILRIPYTAHVTNEEVRRRTGQSPVTSTIVSRRLRLFGHIARADPSQDHSRALQAAINRLPTDWRRRRGRPRRTGSVPSSLTCNRPTLASTQRGFAHKIVPNGVQLWRRLCSPLGVPPDDDDDEYMSATLVWGGTTSVWGAAIWWMHVYKGKAGIAGKTVWSKPWVSVTSVLQKFKYTYLRYLLNDDNDWTTRAWHHSRSTVWVVYAARCSWSRD